MTPPKAFTWRDIPNPNSDDDTQPMEAVDVPLVGADLPDQNSKGQARIRDEKYDNKMPKKVGYEWQL